MFWQGQLSRLKFAASIRRYRSSTLFPCFRTAFGSCCSLFRVVPYSESMERRWDCTLSFGYCGGFKGEGQVASQVCTGGVKSSRDMVHGKNDYIKQGYSCNVKIAKIYNLFPTLHDDARFVLFHLHGLRSLLSTLEKPLRIVTPSSSGVFGMWALSITMLLISQLSLTTFVLAKLLLSLSLSIYLLAPCILFSL